MGKRCTITPKPNYKACSDSLDPVQVTDGKTDKCKWYRTATVGWQRPTTLPAVTVDLGQAHSIESVHIHTVGGGQAGVYFPRFIAVLTSQYGFNYSLVGARIAEEHGERVNESGSKRLLTFRIDQINELGRYVRVIFQPKGVFLFFDEIEVFGTSSSDRRSPLSGERLVVSSSRTDDAVDHVEEVLRARNNAKAMLSWLASHSGSHSNQSYTSSRDDLLTAINRLSGCSPAWSCPKSREEFCRQIRRIRGRLYSELHDGPLYVEVANPMCVARDDDFFAVKGNGQELSVRMWQGEYESAALNVVNCSTETMRLRVSISPIVGPDGEHIDSKETVVLRRGIFGYARDAGVIADALVLQANEEFELEAGDLWQLWFTVHNPGLDVGTYRSWCAVDRVGGDGEHEAVVVPIKLEIADHEFPEHPRLNSIVWAYTDVSSSTRDCVAQASVDLESHYITACTVHRVNASFPKSSRLGLTGSVSSGLDFSRLDRVIDTNATYAKTYVLHLNFDSKTGDHGIFGEWMSSRWKRSFSDWLTQLVGHLKKKGVGYDRFLFYPFDESLCAKFLEVAELTKSIDPNVRIFSNCVGDGVEDCRRFKDVIDVWCIHRKYIGTKPNVAPTLLEWGKQVWVYDARGPGRARDPYSFYRLLPWQAFKHGLEGVGFWAYTDPIERVECWDDHDWSVGFYAAVYGTRAANSGLHGERLAPSRRWEAWREGIEDNEKLRVVRDAIGQLRVDGPYSRGEAMGELEGLVDDVLQRPNDRSAVYAAQRKMDELLHKIKVNARQ